MALVNVRQDVKIELFWTLRGQQCMNIFHYASRSVIPVDEVEWVGEMSEFANNFRDRVVDGTAEIPSEEIGALSGLIWAQPNFVTYTGLRITTPFALTSSIYELFLPLALVGQLATSTVTNAPSFVTGYFRGNRSNKAAKRHARKALLAFREENLSGDEIFYGSGLTAPVIADLSERLGLAITGDAMIIDPAILVTVPILPEPVEPPYREPVQLVTITSWDFVGISTQNSRKIKFS